ncbi:hypothetical protein SAY86_031764 [Trapa natans]|nr:hypothetical protein SAY86_031764 [Trapa natans]
MCNKLASRHVRVGLASPSAVPRCDICENAPAFFYCEVDGTSLCLHCDMIVHVGGKRTHERYLLLRQRVEFPGDKANCEGSAVPPKELADTRIGHPQNQNPKPVAWENHINSREPALRSPNANDADKLTKMDSKMIDLNMKPHRVREQASFNEQ